ncbi:MAG: adenylate/guanylate cyclase domain-containing protein [Treponema sp.]|nr:adenylate/guanylate cyclase domain-containing protein [Treponema sp.]
MSELLQSATKRFTFFGVILSISILISCLLLVTGIIGMWDTFFYDKCINTRVTSVSIDKSPIIATVDLNDASIDILGEQLDSRMAFADIMEVLNDSNASAIYDFLFIQEKSHDTSFIDAIKLSNNTVIAALAIDADIQNNSGMLYRGITDEQRLLLERHVWNINVVKEGKIPRAQTFILPNTSIMDAAAQIALINAEPDRDGIYRRIPLLYKWEDGFLPSLSLAAGVLYWNIQIEKIELKAGEYLSIPFSDNELFLIPIDEMGRVLVPFTENWIDQQNRIPFHKMAEAKHNDSVFDDVFSDLNGKIALLAEISTSQKDFGPTSFERLYPLSGLHAEVLGGILDWSKNRSFIGKCTLMYKILVIFILIGLSFFIVGIKRDIVFHLGFSFIFLGFSLITVLRWEILAIKPWFFFPAVLLFLFWLCTFVNRLFLRYRRQLLLHNALSRYFPHALAQRIIRENKTELKPSYKELTILFSDIAGFTKWSSDKNPEDVHNFLNDYLENMAQIIFAHGGTVDKFMGDGILAFFGDPFDMHNHTEQCVKAAIAMQKKVIGLAEKWKSKVDIDLNVRVGINTGKVIVGNLGSKTRIEYTVIGAAVNLAQRMESNAPLGGILVTADVKNRVEAKFDFPERKDVTVKGYSQVIEAYIVGVI